MDEDLKLLLEPGALDGFSAKALYLAAVVLSGASYLLRLSLGIEDMFENVPKLTIE